MTKTNNHIEISKFFLHFFIHILRLSIHSSVFLELSLLLYHVHFIREIDCFLL